MNVQAREALLSSVEKLLLTVDMPTQEYRLLQALADHPSLQNLGMHPMLILFRKHFALMHCLYRLQEVWVTQGRLLSISPLQISLSSIAEGDGQGVQTADSNIRTFYLDWQQFELATEDGVSEWMASFWTRMATGGEAAKDAYDLLGVKQNGDWEQVVRAYRKKASILHPDKGGDAQQFAAVQNAYETLKMHLGKH